MGLLLLWLACKSERDLRPEDTQDSTPDSNADTDDSTVGDTSTPTFDRSLQFNGLGRIEVPIDDPASSADVFLPDVGDRDFTLEFWLKAGATDNAAPKATCGDVNAWSDANVVVDSSRFDRSRGWGAAVAGNTVVFGAFLDGQATSVCGAFDVLDDTWHHVAMGRRASNGQLFLFIDGSIQAVAKGPAGDISYPDDANPGGATDPSLVFGREKHGGLGFTGFLDEVRLSTKLRYEATFTPLTGPFTADGQTVLLWHLDEQSGVMVPDSSVIDGAPSDGTLVQLGEPAGPSWSAGGAF